MPNPTSSRSWRPKVKTLGVLLEPYKEIRYLPDGRRAAIEEDLRDLAIDEQHRFEVKDNIPWPGCGLLVRYLYPSLHCRVAGRYELR